MEHSAYYYEKPGHCFGNTYCGWRLDGYSEKKISCAAGKSSKSVFTNAFEQFLCLA